VCLRELGRKIGFFRAPHARAGRIAGLRHETIDHPMEDDPVIEALTRELLDLGHMLGRKVGAQADCHVASLARLQHDRVLGIELLRGDRHDQKAKQRGEQKSLAGEANCHASLLMD
jgi:hypothetical protein